MIKIKETTVKIVKKVERRGLEGAHQTTASGWTERFAAVFFLSRSLLGQIYIVIAIRSAVGSVLGNKSGEMDLT